MEAPVFPPTSFKRILQGTDEFLCKNAPTPLTGLTRFGGGRWADATLHCEERLFSGTHIPLVAWT